MPRPAKGSVYQTKNGFGIRWVQGGRRQHRSGFATRTAAREWWADEIRPQLKRGGPSADLTFEEFVDAYFERWEASPKTVQTLHEWLAPALKRFGSYPLRELEGAAHDIAAWQKTFSSDYKRYVATRALRQVLAGGIRWKYIASNPAVDAGPNPQPRGEEIHPFSREEQDRLVAELSPQDAALVVFACETGLRTNEWIALERRDVDRLNPAVAVTRRFANGRATAYPKTEMSRRRVVLTPRAEEALGWLPPRLDSALLFPAPGGGHLNLANWRTRVWYPALKGAGIARRGPYAMRHTFASEALAAGISVYQLHRLMGTSIQMLERTYGHLVRDSEDHLRSLLAIRARSGVDLASEGNEKC